MSLRLLIVSPHFPPVNAPDMQRVRMSLPAFIASGAQVTILTVDDPLPSAPLEPELEATIPREVEVVRVRCLSRGWTARFGLNNVGLRALPFLLVAGCRLLAERRYDAVYFSTTMFIVLPLGRIWEWFAGVPYVLDLQDPWVTDFYSRPGAPRPPGGWKYRVAAGLAQLLEGWTLRGAAHLIAVSPAYIAAAQVRYPAVERILATVLPFGSPDPDLEFIRRRRATRPALLPAGAGLRLVYAGALGPGMLGSVELLFAGLARARARGVIASVHFFGTSYAPAGSAAPVTSELAHRLGVAECVFERTDRLGYLDAWQLTLEAEAGLLFGSTDLAYVPSKLLGVLASGRPALALAPQGSALAHRLAQLGQPCVAFPQRGPLDPSIECVAIQLELLAAGKIPAASPTDLAAHRAEAVAQRQLEIFAAVARSARTA